MKIQRLKNILIGGVIGVSVFDPNNIPELISRFPMKIGRGCDKSIGKRNEEG
jgi:hypothetical protein